MPSVIRVLDETTINKMAAGEVIENPASVVKELVENSLDAGAAEITVEIKGGGRQLIRITDNGCGMSRDDALLCLERHATSKIRAVEDIDALMTMGFRGEAIPSIASISKFQLLTCLQGEESGTLVRVEGGKILSVSTAVRTAGTTIEIQALFFNVPVRRKFQKSPQHDANEILKVLSLLALGNPGVKFQLVHNESLLLQTTGTAVGTFSERLKKRIDEVLGESAASEMKAISQHAGSYAIEGWISSPAQTRPNRTGQYTFINHRAVVSPFVSLCVKDAYSTMLPSGRYPLFVLHLTLPDGWVDPNVHPQKKEVRLRHEQEVRALIMEAVSKGLRQNEYLVEASGETYVEESSLPWENSPAREEKVFPQFTYKMEETPGATPWLKPIQIEQVVFEEKQLEIPSATISWRVIGTLPGYILAEGQGWHVIDQQAAHARLLFEELEKKHTSIAIQQLLVPLTIELTSLEAARLRHVLPQLNSQGLSIREFQGNTFIVDGYPTHWGNLDLPDLLHDFLGEEKEDEPLARRLAHLAARSSMRSSQKLSLHEAQSLVNRLQNCTQPHFCPSGKKIQVPLTAEDVAKLFL